MTNIRTFKIIADCLFHTSKIWYPITNLPAVISIFHYFASDFFPIKKAHHFMKYSYILSILSNILLIAVLIAEQQNKNIFMSNVIILSIMLIMKITNSEKSITEKT